jgi:2-hydroxy-6-oxonona-2,4-dienedioate hydrolase
MSLREFGEKWIDVGGVRTRYFDAGIGPAIVFIHGGTIGDTQSAANGEDWELNFGPMVARGYRCITIDKLGQGFTGNPLETADWTMAGQVRHVQALIRKLNAGPCHLVGHSRGGYIAARVTMESPELARSCTVVDSNTIAPGFGRNDIVFAADPNPPWSREAAAYTYRHYSYGAEHISDEWVDVSAKILNLEKSRAASHAMQKGLYENVFLPGLRADRKSLFERLANDGLLRPTLLIWGFNDPTSPVHLGYGVYDLMTRHQPRTHMHVLNRAGHYSYRERPQEFNRVLHEFAAGTMYGA